MTYRPYRSITTEEYTATEAERIQEDELHEGDAYLFRALLKSRQGQHAGEFLSVTTQLHRSLGRTGVLASIHEADSHEPFLIFNAHLNEGIVTPERTDVHVTHPKTGSIGILEQGYFLVDPRVPSKLGRTALHNFPKEAFFQLQLHADLRTHPFESIALGYN